MPSWKKLVTSGSNAALNQITASGNVQLDGSLNLPQGNVISLNGLGSGTRLYSGAAGQIWFDLNGSQARLKLQQTNAIFSTNILATGNISGSATSTGSFGRVQASVIGGNSPLIIDADNLKLDASGTLSGSSTSVGSFGQLKTANDFIVNSSGRVGINTTSPDYKLDVAGNIGMNEYIFHNGDSDTYLHMLDDRMLLFAGSDEILDYEEGAASTLKLAGGGEADVTIGDSTTFFVGGSQGSYDARVGIGTSTPTAKLDIVGSTRVQGQLLGTDGSAGAPALSFNADGDTGIFKAAANNLALSTGGSERMRISDQGNIGIGDTNPDASGVKLTVKGADNSYKAFFGDTDGTVKVGIYTATNASKGSIGTQTNHKLGLIAGDADRVTILTSGNVGIGTDNPTELLHVNGNTRVHGGLTMSADGEQIRFVNSNMYLRKDTELHFNSSTGFKFTGGNVTFSGNVSGSATSTGSFGLLQGDGREITNLPVTALNNATANELVTVGATTTELDAESLLTWNGNVLGVGIASPSIAGGIHVKNPGVQNTVAVFESADPYVSLQLKDNQGGGLFEFHGSDDAFNFYGSSGGKLNLTVSETKVSGSATSTGSFGHLVIGSDSTTFKNLSIDALTTTSAITVDETSGTSNSAVLNLLADRPSDGQDAAEIRMRNNSATSFARIVGVRGSADTYGDLHFRTRNASGLTTRLAIDQDGLVGIGTTSPTFAAGGGIHLKGSSSAFTSLRISVDSNTGVDFSSDSSGHGYMYNRDNSALIFGTNNTERMRILNSGNVGIGTGSPEVALHVKKTGHNVGLRVTDSSESLGLDFGYDDSSSTEAAIYNRYGDLDASKITFGFGLALSTAPTMTLLKQGRLGIGTESPGSSLDVAGEIRGGRFAFNDDTDTSIDTFAANQIGFALGGNAAVKWAFLAGAVTQQYMYGSSATYPSYTFNSDQDTGMYLATNGAIGFSTGGSERMRINSTGLGIGISNPTAKLHVDGDAIVTGKITAQEFHTEFVSASIQFASGSTKFGDTNDDLHQFTGSMRIQRSDDVSLRLMRGSQLVSFLGDTGSQNDGGLILYDENGTQDILIRAKDATNSFINTTGNFGFGTTVPGNKVHIQETNTDDYSPTGENYANAILRLHNADTSATTPHALIHFRLDKNGGDGYLGFTTDGSTGNVEHFVLGNQVDNEILRVASGGKVGIGTTSPGHGQSTPISGVKLDVAGNQMLSSTSTTNSDQAKLFFFRSDGAVGAQTDIAAATQLGAIEWTGLVSADDNNSISAAKIDVRANTTWNSSANRNADLHFSTVDSNTLAERMTIRYDGNVGIGNTSPAQKLRVEGEIYAHMDVGDSRLTTDSATNSDAQVRFLNGGTLSHVIYADGSDTHDPLRFLDSSTGGVAMSLVNGKLGIGNTSPTQPLTVTGNISGSGTGYFGNIILGGTEQIAVNNGNLYYTGGNLGIGTSSPSKLLHLDSSSGYAEMRLSGTSGGGTLEFYNDSTALGDVYFDTNKHFYVRTGGATQALKLDASQNAEFAGNVSGSATSTGSFGKILGDGSGLTGVTATAGAAGNQYNVQFNSDGSSTAGSNNFVFNSSTNRVGIGTTSPTRALTISGSDFSSTSINLNRSDAGVHNDSAIVFEAQSTAAAGVALGGFWFKNAVDNNTNAIFRVRTDNNAGTNGRFEFITGTGLNNNSTPVMVVKGDSKVGIGDTTPDAILDVDNSFSTATTVMHLTDSGGTGAHTMLQMNNTGGSVSTFNITGNDLQINATADLILQNSGANVGIGTASPAVLLHVSSSSANQFRIERSGTTNAAVHFKNASDDWYAGITSQQDFSISQNSDIASGNEFRIKDSTGFVSMGTTATYGRLTVGGTGEIIALRATSGAAKLSLYEAGTTRAILETLNDSAGGLVVKTPSSAAATFGNSLNTSHRPLVQNGYIKLMDDDGATQAGYIGSGQDLAFGDANDLCIRGTDSIKFTANDGNADAMTIDSSGNVGIGVASNDSKAKFQVEGSTTSNQDYIFRNNDATATSRIIVQSNDTGTNAQLVADHGNTFSWVGSSTGGTNRIVFPHGTNAYFEGGNFGIGNAGTFDNPNSASKVLEIANNQPTALILNDTRDANPICLENRGAVFHITHGTTSRFVISDSTGNIGIGTITPDEKLHVVGNIKATGNVIAENFIVKSTVTQMTQSFSSGSTIFGDTNDDIHQFTGSLSISGSTTRPGLHIKGDNNTSSKIRLENTAGSAVWDIQPLYNDDALAIRDESGNSIVYITDEGSTGRVGINTTTPGYPLVVSKAESAASDFQTNLDIKRTWGSGDSTDRLHGLIFSDSNSVGAGIFMNRFASHANYNSTLMFYINDGSSSSMTPSTALGDPNFVIDLNSSISLANNDNGTGNIIFGKNVADNLDAGSNYNTFIGRNVAAATLNDATHNIAIGDSAMNDITTADNNVAIGSSAMLNMTTATQNVAIGRQAMGLGIVTGAGNVAVGYISLLDLTSGTHNTAIGTAALQNLLDGGSNTAVGYNTAADMTSGTENVSIGKNSMSNATTAGYNVAVGTEAIGLGVATAASGYNTAVGTKSLYDLTSGTSNVALGAEAAQNLTTGVQNVVIGRQALNTATNSSNCVILGLYAGLDINNSAADGTVLVGRSAGENITSAAGNTAVGYFAGSTLTTGASNVVVGYDAMRNSHLGCDKNVVIGRGALYNGEVDEAIFIGFNAGGDGTTTTGANGAVGIGKGALNNLTSGAGNVAVGYQSLDATTTGARNTALGHQALTSLTGYSDNTAIGYNALDQGTSASHNVALGSNAGDVITTGDYNVILGSASDPSGNNGQNQIVVGYGVTGVGDNSVTLGNADVTAIYAAQDSGATIYAAGLVEGSSMTLKENIAEIESPLDKLTKLRGVEFDYKSTKERSIGMIAEEVNEVFPELVNKNEDGEVTAMSYSRMTAVLLEAVKELSQEVKDSREEIRELKKLNNYSKAGDKN